MLLIGLGRLGKCLQNAFEGLQIKFDACSARPDHLPNLPLHNRLLLLCVPDQHLKTWFAAIKNSEVKPAGVVIFSGSLKMSGLRDILPDVQIGRFHPLSSFTQHSRSIPEGITFGISGPHELLTRFKGWAEKLGGNTLNVTDDHAENYHLAAVLAANFQAFFIRWGAEYLQKLGVDPKQALQALAPLVKESVQHGLDHQQDFPFSGPAARKDSERIQTYFQTIKRDDGQLAEVYRILSDKISQAINS